MSNTISTARTVDANLVGQLHATAEALSTIATSNVAAALERVKAEAAALKARVAAAQAAVAEELAGVLACLSGLAADLAAGLDLPALPAPVNVPTISEPIAEAAPVVANVSAESEPADKVMVRVLLSGEDRRAGAEANAPVVVIGSTTCPKCGFAPPRGATFCNACNVSVLPEPAPVQPTSKPRRGGKKAVGAERNGSAHAPTI